MTLTVADCSAYIDQVLASELSSELTYTSLVNHAGEHLIQMHPWRWLEQPAHYVDVRGNISFTGGLLQVGGTQIELLGGFTDYTFLEGDTVVLSAGTGIVPGRYRIASADDDSITLATSAGSYSGVSDVRGAMALDAAALPSDFYELIAYNATQSLTNWLNLVTLSYLDQLRTQEISVTSRQYFGALTYATPVSGGTPVPRLEHYPASTENRSEEFIIRYRSGWRSVSDDGDALSIPIWMDTLYIQLLRAFAQGYEEYDEASLQQRLVMMQQSPEFILAKQRDGQLQPDYGFYGGGAAQGYGYTSNRYLRTTVNGPS